MEKRLKAYEVLKDSIARDSEEPADEDSGTDRSDPARRPAGQEQLVPAGSPRSGGRKPAKGDVKAICRKSLRAKSRIDKLEKLIEPFKAWEEVLEEYMRFDSEEPDDEEPPSL
jgi:hypothetical protein